MSEIEAQSLILVECAAGSVSRDPYLQHQVSWMGAEIGRFESIGVALRAFADAGEAFGGAVTVRMDLALLLSALEEEGVGEFLPWSPDGWVCHDDTWVPSCFLPDYDGPTDRFAEVHSEGELGVSATVHEWEGHYLVSWSGPEGEDRGWELLIGTTEQNAIDEASDRVASLLAEWGLQYDPYVGLDNVSDKERFELPGDAELILDLFSFPDSFSGPAAELKAYFRSGADGPEILLTTATSNTVIGRYRSVAEMERAVTLEHGFDFELSRISWADEPDD